MPEFFSTAEGIYDYKNSKYIYQYKDHLGNVRLSYADIDGSETIDSASEILEENNYYPFGLKHQGYNEIANNNRSEAAEKYKYSGKEWNDELGLDLYDFHARNYDPAIGRWLNVDPLAEKYPHVGGYVYTLNNPIMFIDPDGREVKGANSDSAKKLHEDMNTVFADKKFDSFRGLLTRGKKNNKTTFDKISGDAFKNATSGLTGDDLDAATSVYNAINSDSEFVFEYLKSSDANLSTSGNKAFVDWTEQEFGSNIGGTLGKEVTHKADKIIQYGGEGLTVSTAKGVHAFIIDSDDTKHLEGRRALTSFHEGFGHGFGIINKLPNLNNNYNAIRYENMIRRVMGISTMRDGTNPFHGGGKVPNHSGKPLIR